jgi:hypothetical protein
MAKIGRSITRVENLSNDNAAAAYRRFARSSTDAEDRRMRQEVTVALIGLLAVLGLVGWALTL